MIRRLDLEALDAHPCFAFSQKYRALLGDTVRWIKHQRPLAHLADDQVAKMIGPGAGREYSYLESEIQDGYIVGEDGRHRFFGTRITERDIVRREKDLWTGQPMFVVRLYRPMDCLLAVADDTETFECALCLREIRVEAEDWDKVGWLPDPGTPFQEEIQHAKGRGLDRIMRSCFVSRVEHGDDVLCQSCESSVRFQQFHRKFDYDYAVLYVANRNMERMCRDARKRDADQRIA